jgi:hypothetical protein
VSLTTRSHERSTSSSREPNYSNEEEWKIQIERHRQESEEEEDLKVLETLAKKIIQMKIRFVACQKLIHPYLQRLLMDKVCTTNYCSDTTEYSAFRTAFESPCRRLSGCHRGQNIEFSDNYLECR